MNIFIRTIPHIEQRYDTVGDWWFDPFGDLQIRVSDLEDPAKEFLVARHECDEAMICQYRNISEESVTAFDTQFERDRQAGLHSLSDEPGMSTLAPYHDAHVIASSAERLLAPFLGVDWKEYNNAIETL